MQPFGTGFMPGFFGGMQGMQGGEGYSMSYSSSSVSYGGPGGVTYSRQESARSGPGGVREHQVHQYDSRSGQEFAGMTRGIGDRGHTMARTRFQDGREEHMDQLHNMMEDEAPQFDEQWQRASNTLPGRQRRGLLGGFGGSRRAQLPA